MIVKIATLKSRVQGVSLGGNNSTLGEIMKHNAADRQKLMDVAAQITSWANDLDVDEADVIRLMLSTPGRTKETRQSQAGSAPASVVDWITGAASAELITSKETDAEKMDELARLLGPDSDAIMAKLLRRARAKQAAGVTSKAAGQADNLVDWFLMPRLPEAS